MRTIIFRGIRINSNEMIYGNLNHQVGSGYFIYPIGDPEVLNSPDYYQVKPETIGQFTGLRDINENDIYEGDILALGSYDDWIVTFRDGLFGIYNSKNPYGKFFEIDKYFCQMRGVIGNIHQKPE
jgi:uncharacterized phage protein (TIGR01671 family)